MARKKVIDLDADKTFAFEKKGEQVEGYYIGSKKVETNFGGSQLHILQTEDGAVGVWGSKQLDSKLAQIQKGVMVYITYNGKVKVPNGTMKTFDVDFDDELSIDVSGTTTTFSRGSSSEDEEEDTAVEAGAADSEEAADVDPEDDSDEDEEAEVEKNPVKKAPLKGKPATVSADQRSKAQALLNRQRGKTA